MIIIDTEKATERAMWWRHKKRRLDRISVKPARTLTSALSTSFYAGAIALFACWPAVPVLAIFHRFGTVIGPDIRIAPTGQAFLVAISGAIFLMSILLRGVAKVLLKPRYVGLPWLIVIGSAVGIGLALFTVTANAAISGVHPGANNSDGNVLAFFGFWLLSVGNAAAAVSTEAAERIAAWIEPNLFESARGLKQAQGSRS